MEGLSPEQLARLITDYNASARSLNEFQVRFWDEFSLTQQLDLNTYQNSLLNRAYDLETKVVSPYFTGAVETIETILKTTAQTRQTIQTIESANIGLNLGATLVALAAAIARSSVRSMEVALREMNGLLTMQE
jgi:hypothetical protein